MKIAQYISDVLPPATMRVPDVSGYMAGAEYHQAAGRLGAQVSDLGAKLGAQQAALENEKAEARLHGDALDRFTRFSREQDIEETKLKESSVDPKEYVPKWEEMHKGLLTKYYGEMKTDSKAAYLFSQRAAPATIHGFGQANQYAHQLWESDRQAKEANGLDGIQQSAAAAGANGLPQTYVDIYIQDAMAVINSAKGAKTAAQLENQRIQVRQKITDSYLDSYVNTRPMDFLYAHTQGMNADIQAKITSQEYWKHMDRAWANVQRGETELKRQFTDKSEKLTKAIQSTIITGGEVPAEYLALKSSELTEGNFSHLDALRRTYEDYNVRDVKTDNGTYDQLNARIIRDEMTSTGDLIPFKSRLSRESFTHLYTLINTRNDRRLKDEHSPRQQLTRAGKGLLSRTFQEVNGAMDFNREVNQVLSSAMGYYEETIARDAEGKIDPMDLARDIAYTHARTVADLISYGTVAGERRMAPLLKYQTFQELNEVYGRGGMNKADYNGQLDIMRRRDVLLHSAPADKKRAKQLESEASKPTGKR